MRTQRLPFRLQNLLLGLMERAWRVLTNTGYRAKLRMRFGPRDQQFQPFNQTALDRYPRIFLFVQSRLGADMEANILSFGCATGEEVFSLRRYFPAARIKGIDINPSNIKKCRRQLRRHPDPELAFEIGNSTTPEPSATYDAIFCMAVLRHGKLAECTQCDHLIRFEDFARTIEDFRRCLKPGGILVIRHANFRLCDAPCAPHFEVLLRVAFAPHARTPIFGPDNRLMCNTEYTDTVFRRTS